jgi:hypothetical protein
VLPSGDRIKSVNKFSAGFPAAADVANALRVNKKTDREAGFECSPKAARSPCFSHFPFMKKRSLTYPFAFYRDREGRLIGSAWCHVSEIGVENAVVPSEAAPLSG